MKTCYEISALEYDEHDDGVKDAARDVVEVITEILNIIDNESDSELSDEHRANIEYSAQRLRDFCQLIAQEVKLESDDLLEGGDNCVNLLIEVDSLRGCPQGVKSKVMDALELLNGSAFTYSFHWFTNEKANKWVGGMPGRYVYAPRW